jgi:hypothetical protein
MKIDDILALWSEDAVPDITAIGENAMAIGRLHHKYFTILIQERMLVQKYMNEMKQLRLEKREFLVQGPSNETKDFGWKLPPKGKIIKSEVDMYLDGDQDIIELSLKIAMQNEKLELLESIIKVVINRNYTLRIALDWEKFKTGA